MRTRSPQHTRAKLREAGDFSRVHPFPQSGQDVPDDLDARLVVLDPEHPYTRGGASPAETQAQAIFESRGNAPRIYRNTLVFLAADATRLQELDQAVRRLLAWESIVGEKEQLNLAPHQVRQADTQREAAATEMDSRIPETYRWLLVPGQATPQSEVTWDALNLTGSDSLAVRAANKLKTQEGLVTGYAASLLRMELDRVPLWRQNHVSVAQLVEDFARYLYLPRLRDPQVLLRSITDGVSSMTWEQDGFAFADSYDEAKGRYRNLRTSQQIMLPDAHAPGLLVKPEVAGQQLDEEVPLPAGPDPRPGPDPPPPPPPSPKPTLKRYHGSVTLDTARVGLSASQIAEEVIAHLNGLPGAQVTVTLDIQADIPEGAPDHVVRTVTENSRTLRFTDLGFEPE